jgi:hypothetical protein
MAKDILDPKPVEKQDFKPKTEDVAENENPAKDEKTNEPMIPKDDPSWAILRDLTIKNNILTLKAAVAAKEAQLNQLGYGKKEVTGEIPRVDSVRIVQGGIKEAVFVYFDGAEVVATVGDKIPYGYVVSSISYRQVALKGPSGMVYLRMGGVSPASGNIEDSAGKEEIAPLQPVTMPAKNASATKEGG